MNKFIINIFITDALDERLFDDFVNLFNENKWECCYKSLQDKEVKFSVILENNLTNTEIDNMIRQRIRSAISELKIQQLKWNVFRDGQLYIGDIECT